MIGRILWFLPWRKRGTFGSRERAVAPGPFPKRNLNMRARLHPGFERNLDSRARSHLGSERAEQRARANSRPASCVTLIKRSDDARGVSLRECAARLSGRNLDSRARPHPGFERNLDSRARSHLGSRIVFPAARGWRTWRTWRTCRTLSLIHI